jgi:hypothetical protein
MTQVQIAAGHEPRITAPLASSADGAFPHALSLAQAVELRGDGSTGYRDGRAGQITKHKYKQSTPTSCAAAALLCACWEMRLVPHASISARQAKAIEARLNRRMIALSDSPPLKKGCKRSVSSGLLKRWEQGARLASRTAPSRLKGRHYNRVLWNGLGPQASPCLRVKQRINRLTTNPEK